MSESLKDSKQMTGDISAVITVRLYVKFGHLAGIQGVTSGGGCALPKPLSLPEAEIVPKTLRSGPKLQRGLETVNKITATYQCVCRTRSGHPIK